MKYLTIIFILLINIALSNEIKLKKSFTIPELDYFDISRIQTLEHNNSYFVAFEYVSKFSINEIGFFQNEYILNLDKSLNQKWGLELPKNYNRFSSNIYISDNSIESVGSYTRGWQNFIYGDYKLDSWKVDANGNIFEHKIDTVSDHSILINTTNVEMKLKNGSYLSIASNLHFNLPFNMAIRKYDTNNKLEFEKFILQVPTRDTLFKPRNTIELDNGEIIVVGDRELYVSDLTKIDNFLMKLDKDYNVIWKKEFENEFNSSSEILYQNKDDEFVVITDYFIGKTDYNNGDRPQEITKFDVDGNILANKKFGFTNACYTKDLIQIQNNNYVAVGSHINNFQEQYGDYYYAILDEDFNVISQDSIQSDYDTGQALLSVIETADNKCLIAGSNIKNLDLFELDLSTTNAGEKFRKSDDITITINALETIISLGEIIPTNAKVIISNLNGKIYSPEFTILNDNSNTTIRFNHSELPSGLYLISVRSGERNYSTKVVY